jgi:hypothetical protein
MRVQGKYFKLLSSELEIAEVSASHAESLSVARLSFSIVLIIFVMSIIGDPFSRDWMPELAIWRHTTYSWEGPILTLSWKDPEREKILGNLRPCQNVSIVDAPENLSVTYTYGSNGESFFWLEVGTGAQPLGAKYARPRITVTAETLIVNGRIYRTSTELDHLLQRTSAI